MRYLLSAALLSLILQCNAPDSQATFLPAAASPSFSSDPWKKFLQSLPVSRGSIKDYTGNAIADQSKHYQLVNYDVGTRDLQQCADFLIRLRAEFLFANNRSGEIAFRFTSGQNYSFGSYCEGKTPVLSGGRVAFRTAAARPKNYTSLRKYLDHIYAYAGTVSLNRDLPTTARLEIGTVIMHPGTPGHCMIIVDEQTIDGEKRYKLAESFMPAQTPYILKNPADESPWYKLEKGRPIRTSSFSFVSYALKSFE